MRLTDALLGAADPSCSLSRWPPCSGRASCCSLAVLAALVVDDDRADRVQPDQGDPGARTSSRPRARSVCRHRSGSSSPHADSASQCRSSIVYATLGIAAVILFESALSFLGAGVPPPAASWGTMISGARQLLPIGSEAAASLPGAAIAARECWRSTFSATRCETPSTRGSASSEREGTASQDGIRDFSRCAPGFAPRPSCTRLGAARWGWPRRTLRSEPNVGRPAILPRDSPSPNAIRPSPSSLAACGGQGH